MRIGKRLILSYGALLSFLAVLTFLLVFSLSTVSKNRERAEFAHAQMDCLNELDRTINRQSKELLDTLIIGSDQEYEEFKEYSEKTFLCLESWRKLIDQEVEFVDEDEEEEEDEEHDILNAIRNQYQTIIAEVDSQLRNTQPEQLVELTEMLEERFDDQIFPLIEDVIEDERAEVLETQKSAKRSHAIIIWTAGGVLALALAAVAICCVLITRSITRPLDKLRTAVEQVKGGNLDVEVEVNSRDEIENLADAFRRMTQDLKKSTVTIDSLNFEIERREKLEAELQNTNIELRDFVHIASHHMREPLRKIRSFGNLLGGALSGNLAAEEQENLNFMIQGARRMDEVITSLLRYSRLDNQTLRPKSVSLKEAVESLLQNELADINRADDAVEISSELPAIWADEDLAREVMYHLISNAFKYRRKDVSPHISITAEAVDDDQVRILVQDNGIGLNEVYHENIFKMFKKVTAEDDSCGPGIGLALCKKIVTKHGGDIGMTSPPEQGSIFWFTMPAAHEPAATFNAAGVS